MTLNDLERRNSPYFAFFSRNSTDFQADYITVVEDRPIMSVNIASQFQSSTTTTVRYVQCVVVNII